MEITQASADLGSRVSIGHFIKKGWRIFKSRPWFLLGIFVSFIIVSIGLSFLNAVLLVGLKFILPDLSASLISFLFNITAHAFLGTCIIAFTLRAYDSIETVGFKEAWLPKNFWQYVGTYFLYFFVITVGYLLFIVPGVIWSIRYCFAPYIAVDKGLSPLAAMRESARITEGSKWRLLSLTFAVVCLFILGFLAFIVGVMVAAVIAYFAFVDAYRSLDSNTKNNKPITSLTWVEKTLNLIVPLFIVLFIGSLAFAFVKIPNPKAVFVISTEDQQPAQAVLPLNATRIPFTVFTIQNNTQKEITILGIDLQASKLNDNKGVSGVDIIDGNGILVGSTGHLDSKNETTIESSFIIQPMSSTTLSVLANISGCDHACSDEGENLSISVIGVRSSGIVIGVWPVRGAEHIMNSTLKLGTVSAVPVGKSSDYTNLLNAQDVKLISTKFTAGTEEDIRLYSIRYKYVGTLDFRKISNVQATLNGKNYHAWFDGVYATINIPEGIPVVEGESITSTLHSSVNTEGSQKESVEFDIENSSDAFFRGETYGYGISPISTFEESAWQRGNTFLVK